MGRFPLHQGPIWLRSANVTKSQVGRRVERLDCDHNREVQRLKPEEEWARQLIERALNVPVVQNDDGSKDGMHDLEIQYFDRLAAAVEVVAAADQASIELWKLVNSDGRWTEPELRGGWMAALLPTARARDLRHRLPSLLREFEADGIRSVEPRSGRRKSRVDERVAQLGIAHLHQSGTDFPGSIYFTIELPLERSGGFVADTGDALAVWAGEYLSGDRCSDVRRKLASSGASERHAFVLVPGFAEANFAVTDLLMRESAPLPQVEPLLPAEITHFWAVSTWRTGSGMRWASGDGWSRFGKTDEGGASD